MRRSWLIELAPGNAATQNDILGWAMQTRTFSTGAAAVERDKYRARGFWVRVSQEFGRHTVTVYEPMKPRARRPADTRPTCSDCGKENETAGHQDCQFPQDHP